MTNQRLIHVSHAASGDAFRVASEIWLCGLYKASIKLEPVHGGVFYYLDLTVNVDMMRAINSRLEKSSTHALTLTAPTWEDSARGTSQLRVHELADAEFLLREIEFAFAVFNEGRHRIDSIE